MVTQDRLLELFDYNEETGQLIRIKYVNYRALNGDVAGSLGGVGYLMVGVDGVRYYVHRVVWMMVYGEWPDCIDHINHDRLDNRLCNLRSVSKKDNLHNKRKTSKNTSGVVGVCWFKRDSNWMARIQVDGIHIHLGYFDTIEEATLARSKANLEYGFHTNHGK